MSAPDDESLAPSTFWTRKWPTSAKGIAETRPNPEDMPQTAARLWGIQHLSADSTIRDYNKTMWANDTSKSEAPTSPGNKGNAQAGPALATPTEPEIGSGCARAPPNGL